MGITVPLIPTACCTASVLGTVAPLAQAVADLHLRMLKRADYDVFDTTMKVPLATRPFPVQMPPGVGRSVLQCVRACVRATRAVFFGVQDQYYLPLQLQLLKGYIRGSF
jgi:hypothetical protein